MTPLPADQDADGQRVFGKVGCGGLGIVYEARQITIARRVALKVLPLAAVVTSLVDQEWWVSAEPPPVS
jgi:hypothetical protein